MPGAGGLAVPAAMEGDLDYLMEAFTKYHNPRWAVDTHWLILVNLTSGFLKASKAHLQGNGMSTRQGGPVSQAYSDMIKIRRDTIASRYIPLNVSCSDLNDVGYTDDYL